MHTQTHAQHTDTCMHIAKIHRQTDRQTHMHRQTDRHTNTNNNTLYIYYHTHTIQ